MLGINRLLSANSGGNVAVLGDYIWLKSATGAVQLKTDRGDVAILNEGDYVRTNKKFTEFFVTDMSGSQNDITMVIAEGGDAGKYGGSVTIALPTTLEDATDVTVTAGVNTILLAANSGRSEAIITSLSGNTNESRIGSSSASATRGIPLPVGGSITLSTKAAIYCFNAAADTFAISYTVF